MSVCVLNDLKEEFFFISNTSTRVVVGKSEYCRAIKGTSSDIKCSIICTV